MKRENFERAKVVNKLLEEVELKILNLETVITKFCDSDSIENTVELRIYPLTVPNHTVHHVFTFDDIVEISHTRKDILIKERRKLLDELETL